MKYFCCYKFFILNIHNKWAHITYDLSFFVTHILETSISLSNNILLFSCVVCYLPHQMLINFYIFYHYNTTKNICAKLIVQNTLQILRSISQEANCVSSKSYTNSMFSILVTVPLLPQSWYHLCSHQQKRESHFTTYFLTLFLSFESQPF